MTWENNDWFFDSIVWVLNSMDSWAESMSNRLWKWFDLIWHYISDWFSSIWNVFMQTYVWKILGFIWDIITFLLYWARSIILLVRNLIYSILNWSVQLFTQLMSTFTDLSLFLWSSTSILISLFSLVLFIICFQFLIRFFIWKFHYKWLKWSK